VILIGAAITYRFAAEAVDTLSGYKRSPCLPEGIFVRRQGLKSTVSNKLTALLSSFFLMFSCLFSFSTDV
jgi:hypothetical protein